MNLHTIKQRLSCLDVYEVSLTEVLWLIARIEELERGESDANDLLVAAYGKGYHDGGEDVRKRFDAYIDELRRVLRMCMDLIDVENLTTQAVYREAETVLTRHGNS